ncbi:MAG: hypothetical protein LBR87_02610, partial [Synergistaceae bacterium]|nr:hypothetical protein [Synergistaceae bacterium]
MSALRRILAVPVLALALITGAAASPAPAADKGADGIGMVLAVDGAAEAVRGGSRLALKVRDRLRENDT